MFKFNQGRMAKKVHAHKNNNGVKCYFIYLNRDFSLATIDSFKEAKLSICSLISEHSFPKMIASSDYLLAKFCIS